MTGVKKPARCSHYVEKVDRTIHDRNAGVAGQK
jgi:hypothetical protein